MLTIVTDWRAEHAIRPAVVTRKVRGGNRTARGAETQQILASVLRTLDQRGLDPGDVFTSLLHACQAIVAPALQGLCFAGSVYAVGAFQARTLRSVDRQTFGQAGVQD